MSISTVRTSEVSSWEASSSLQLAPGHWPVPSSSRGFCGNLTLWDSLNSLMGKGKGTLPVPKLSPLLPGQLYRANLSSGLEGAAAI